MIDLELLSVPENPTPSELRDVALIMKEALTELQDGYQTLHDGLEALDTTKDEQVVTLNRPVYLQEIPEGQRWTKIVGAKPEKPLWRYLDDNGSVYIKNQTEYEEAMRNEAYITSQADTTPSENSVEENGEVAADGETGETAE